jgi:hypothetical protein
MGTLEYILGVPLGVDVRISLRRLSQIAEVGRCMKLVIGLAFVDFAMNGQISFALRPEVALIMTVGSALLWYCYKARKACKRGKETKP